MKLSRHLINIFFIVFVMLTLVRVVIYVEKYYVPGANHQEQKGMLEYWLREGNLPTMYAALNYVFIYPFYVWIPLEISGKILFFIMLNSYLISLFILTKTFFKNPSKYVYLIIFILFLNFSPALEIIIEGKIEAIELLLISLCFFYLERNKEIISGFLIPIAAHLKFFPGILSYYFFLTFNKKVIKGFIYSGLFLLIVFFSFYGFNETFNLYKIYIDRYSSPKVAYSNEALVINTSLSGFILKNFFLIELPENIIEHGKFKWGDLKLARKITLLARLLFLLIITSLFIFSFKIQRNKNQFTKLCILLVSIFFIAPYTRSLYAILLVPCYIYIFSLVTKPNYKNNKFFLLFLSIAVLSFLMVSLIVPLSVLKFLPFLNNFSPLLVYYWLYNVPFIGYCLLLISLFMIDFYPLLTKKNRLQS